MRQTWMFLTTADVCQRLPGELVCSSEEHRAEMLAQDRLDRAACDEAALKRAIERGVVLP
jgi:hypothetical protein